MACAWAVDDDSSATPAAGWLLRALPRVEAPVVLLGAPGDGSPVPSRIAVPRLTADERAAALRACLERHGTVRVPAREIAEAAAVFDLPVADLDAAAAAAAAAVPLWQACRARARQRFDGLARLVEPHAGWDDLVLPPAQTRAAAGARGRGAAPRDRARRRGASRPAARAVWAPPRCSRARAAPARPSRPRWSPASWGSTCSCVDLSQVVSKYIGETEKHLARLFDAAEDGGAVLLFDEADTLFGKRTEVRDSHDRYANLEVGYLLQRMESFRGLAILTTNARAALDPAFLRRLRVVVSFPYPDAEAREEMWRRAFPPATPTAGLDPRCARRDRPAGRRDRGGRADGRLPGRRAGRGHGRGRGGGDAVGAGEARADVDEPLTSWRGLGSEDGLDQVGSVVGQRPLQCCGEVLGAGHAPSRHAEPLGEVDPVDARDRRGRSGARRPARAAPARPGRVRPAGSGSGGWRTPPS